MAQYEDLPVYKATYDLLLGIFRFTKDFSREYSPCEIRRSLPRSGFHRVNIQLVKNLKMKQLSLLLSYTGQIVKLISMLFYKRQENMLR
jgi:hypothetical protein